MMIGEIPSQKEKGERFIGGRIFYVNILQILVDGESKKRVALEIPYGLLGFQKFISTTIG